MFSVIKTNFVVNLLIVDSIFSKLRHGAGGYHQNVLRTSFLGPSLIRYPAHPQGFLQICLLISDQFGHPVFRLLGIHVPHLHPTPRSLRHYQNSREETQRRTDYSSINGISLRLPHLLLPLQLCRMEYGCVSTTDDSGLQIFSAGLQLG